MLRGLILEVIYRQQFTRYIGLAATTVGELCMTRLAVEQHQQLLYIWTSMRSSTV